MEVVRLRNYDIPQKQTISATISEAARATSAATSLFDPVKIGAREFVDGALGANNPIEAVEDEASHIWCTSSTELEPLVKCIVSIGTGNPGKKAIEENPARFLTGTLANFATETEATEKKFIARWCWHYDKHRYFRFNVDQGLQDVGLAEYLEQGRIEAVTYSYLDHQVQISQVQKCIENLKLKDSVCIEDFA